ncbi:membrane protein insertase YidC [Saccharomonospora cyanea]|uniref:Membrane protein insertase YidC n=1 Tax=Saccharomonospora cyanea NA-134 TaxID=882082 RepID=H5XIX1_9PSEU|nr:membrane protein insertase YidC [Saccharomonospora cyanea]EHR60745.1 membrane protein insertase, YidC/Oxa1 family [Saccharomonospora cyanea NA-134]
MFDVLLLPVSAVLWFWHRVTGSLLDPDSGSAWALAIVFLVFSVRALLVRPTLSQLRAARRMRDLAPHVQRIRAKYRDDRARTAQEIQKLHADHGTSMLAGCLPALLQIPVFLSLFWVLRGFAPEARTNHVFDREGVESFLGADLFGAKLGNWLSQSTAELAAFGTDRLHMVAVGGPLLLVASLATYLSMRMSLWRQGDTAAVGGPAVFGKTMVYLAPAGMLLSGALFPVPLGVLLYFLANNLWTFGQQYVLTRVLDREEERARAVRPKAAGPRPGQKPRRNGPRSA